MVELVKKHKTRESCSVGWTNTTMTNNNIIEKGNMINITRNASEGEDQN